MKKILCLLVLLLLVTGCGMKMESTPREKVEDWMSNYQMYDDSITGRLKDFLDGQELEEETRKEYQNVLEKQHQNLSYNILSEDIDEDKATVEVEIEVLDYYSSFNKSRNYFKEHQEEFMDSVVEEQDIDNLKEFIEYKIKELSKVNEKTKYNITFHLIKVDNDWEIEDVDQDTFLKMYGLY